MRRNGNTGQGGQGRTIALLCALAVLAERAAADSAPVRLLVLWLLRAAEAIARDYVFAIASESGWRADLPSTSVIQAGDGPTEALRLAVQLRALAALLQAMACCLSPAVDGRRSRTDEMASLRVGLRLMAAIAALMPCCQPFTQPAPDTS